MTADLRLSPRGGSLQGRLLISYLAVTLVVLVTVLVLALGYLERSGLNQRRESLLSHARVVAGVSAQYMLKGHDYLEYIARDYGGQVGARVLILDRPGRVLYDSFYEEDLIAPDLSARPEVASALENRATTRLTTVPGAGRTLYAAAPIREQGQVVGAVLVVQVVEAVWEELAPIRRALLLVSGAALAIALATGWVLAQSLARPLRQLTAGVWAVEAGDLGHQVAVRGRDELGRLAEAFNRMAARLARVEESRRTFVANAAHELRTPLASLRALMEPLLSGAVSPAEQGEFLQDMGREVDRLTELAGDLLTLSELEAGRPLQIEPLDLPTLLMRVQARLAPLAREAGVLIWVEAPAEMEVRADAIKMERVLYNLAHNALTFSPRGGSVTLQATGHDDTVTVTVTDQGPGIPPEDLPHIFERFYRSERSRSRERGGAGLGLAIGREIVQGHGGRVWAESKAGEGTSFVVQIPASV